MRLCNLLTKVFLHHLPALFALTEFTTLWLCILDFMDKYMHAGGELLLEAVPESLKNMLLVMSTSGIFSGDQVNAVLLWDLTWHRVHQFLPDLRATLFPDSTPGPAFGLLLDPAFVTLTHSTVSVVGVCASWFGLAQPL
eukprot:m.538737 g.538737  ORF g.538737 m.538737 type:complete len:139 (+) comp57629_c0_seq5:4092-4508(+)